MKNYYNEQNENEILKAILEESGIGLSAQALLKRMYITQQAIIDCLEEIIKHDKWNQQSINRRLNELLAEIDPKAAEKRKNEPQAESSAGIEAPGKALL